MIALKTVSGFNGSGNAREGAVVKKTVQLISRAPMLKSPSSTHNSPKIANKLFGS